MSISVIRIGIAGAGRMGTAIADLVAASDDLSVAGFWTRHPGKLIDAALPDTAYAGDDLERLLALSDVLVDFSLPDGTERVAPAAAKAGVPLVCGVSGLSDTQYDGLRAASRDVPVVYDRNMSQGVAVLKRLVQSAAAALPGEFEIRIDETHHVHKMDAPSGTALKLGEAAAAARGLDFRDAMHYDDATSPAAGQIGFAVERTGEVPGDHAVTFANDAERLTLEHSVRTRDVFARGALTAARWIVGRPAGFYSMDDVLFGGSGD